MQTSTTPPSPCPLTPAGCRIGMLNSIVWMCCRWWSRWSSAGRYHSCWWLKWLNVSHRGATCGTDSPITRAVFRTIFKVTCVQASSELHFPVFPISSERIWLKSVNFWYITMYFIAVQMDEFHVQSLRFRSNFWWILDPQNCCLLTCIIYANEISCKQTPICLPVVGMLILSV